MVLLSQCNQKDSALSTKFIAECLSRVDLSSTHRAVCWSDAGRHFMCNEVMVTTAVHTFAEMPPKIIEMNYGLGVLWI